MKYSLELELYILFQRPDYKNQASLKCYKILLFISSLIQIFADWFLCNILQNKHFMHYILIHNSHDHIQ